MRSSKIYTKKGDKGETSTLAGKIHKSGEVAEALGTIDELNSWIGYCVINNRQIAEELKRIQTNLMTVNSIIAGSESKFEDDETAHLENLIDKWQRRLPELKNFIYPIGDLQYARALARKAERRVAGLKERKKEEIMRYLNRLSDALFVMGRWINQQNKVQEDIWKG